MNFSALRRLIGTQKFARAVFSGDFKFSVFSLFCHGNSLKIILKDEASIVNSSLS